MAEFSGTYIYRPNVAPETRSAVSSRHKIYSFAAGENKEMQIGVVGTFDPSHGRGVDPVRGIGYGDQIAELVPSVADPVTISVSRTLLYLSNIFQVFGYNAGPGLVRDLKHHRWPFDIKSELCLSGVTDNSSKKLTKDGQEKTYFAEGTMAVKDGTTIAVYQSIITIYECCWITSYSTSYPADSSIVTETVDISVTDVLGAGGRMDPSSYETGNSLFSTGGSGASYSRALTTA